MAITNVRPTGQSVNTKERELALKVLNAEYGDRYHTLMQVLAETGSDRAMAQRIVEELLWEAEHGQGR